MKIVYLGKYRYYFIRLWPQIPWQQLCDTEELRQCPKVIQSFTDAQWTFICLSFFMPVSTIEVYIKNRKWIGKSLIIFI